MLHCSKCDHRAPVAPPGGQCPVCKQAFLIPEATEAPFQPEVEVAAAPRSSLAVKIIVPFLAIGLAFLGWHFGGLVMDRLRNPSEPVLGEYATEALGLSVSLPRTWRHLENSDEHSMMGPSDLAGGAPLTDEQQDEIGTMTADGAMFFRGRLSTEPDAMVVIGSITFSAETTRAGFSKSFVEAASAGVQNMVGAVMKKGPGTQVTMGPCESGQTRAEGGAHCRGTATFNGESYQVRVELWPTPEHIWIAIYFAHAGDPEAQSEAQEIVKGITPYR